MRIMNGLKLFAGIGALSFAVAGTAHAKDVTKFKINGNSASVNANDGTYSLDMNVTRDDTSNTSPVTNLFFFRTTCDTNGCTGTRGFGQIPSSEFKPEMKSAKLNVNLASIPGFQMFSFNNPFIGDPTETPITPTGVIIVEWKQVARDSQKFVGTTTIKNGQITQRFSGTTYSTRASITGSFAGSPIVNATGFINSNENVNVEIIHD